ncbi:MAG TPA: ATP-binding cassette domain-containing protein [Clostridia bacterium]|nr:ATP-binding cassette domain-containing protein [Clostridia bacterium]
MSLIVADWLSKDYLVKGENTDVRGVFQLKKIKKRVVDGISFSISAGEIVGYIGPNGAGKSTTI